MTKKTKRRRPKSAAERARDLSQTALEGIRTQGVAAPTGTVGVPVPIGTEGVVQAPLEPLGTVYLAGETWSARAPDTRPVPRGTTVRLVGFDGLTALVEPSGSPAPAPTPTAPYPSDVR
jgi:hypothetical protein